MSKQRAEFTLALKRSRCPKDGGHVLEVSMPEVVCEKCSTVYMLAIQSGTFLMRYKLIEKQAPQPTIVREREVTQREIVRVPCKYCGSLNDLATAKFCSSCGAPIK